MAERAPDLRTDRLVLRHWHRDDKGPFAALNANPAVAEMLDGPLSEAESDAFADRLEARLSVSPFGGWAVEAIGIEPFVGMVGLDVVEPEFPFAPAVEAAWRLDPDFWGRGFATEAALVALAYGFEHCGLDEVVAFTAASNLRSQAVMERLGMVRDVAGDFEHPRVAPTSPLRAHVLYRARSVVVPAYGVLTPNR